LEIDVQGAMAVLEQEPNAITVFVHPGSMEELERRLRNRATETEDVVRRRLDVAAEEMSYRHLYRHELINIDVDQTVESLCGLLHQYQ
jgi:guanylate kinase